MAAVTALTSVSLLLGSLTASAAGSAVHDVAHIQVAACTDPFATTFVRVDLTDGQRRMNGVFYHVTPISSEFVKPAPAVELKLSSEMELYDTFATAVSDEKGMVRGHLSLSFPPTLSASMSSKETAYAAFVDQAGNLNSAKVECYLTFAD